MPSSETAAEPAVRTYARLLHQLHRFIAEGTGDSDEADIVRDEMDAPWYAMTKVEQERVGGLSEDLYALAGISAKPLPLSPTERSRWEQDIRNARDSENWDQMLKLLRCPPADMPSAAVAFMQAQCWESLGDLETARV